VLRIAANIANLNYGQANGFTCHSLSPTFITDWTEKTCNDAGTVTRYSGHKTLESFSSYLHPSDQGRILAIQALNSAALGAVLRDMRDNRDSKKTLITLLQTKEVPV